MGGYRWQVREPAGDELRRIARTQLERALMDLQDPDPDTAVHAARKRGKKLRALLRLVRADAPELYARENAAIRDASRRVAADRDASVAPETYDDLVGRFVDAAASRGLAPVRAALIERREAVVADDLARRLDAFRDDLEAVLERVDTWEVVGDGFDVVEGGLGKAYGRARKRMADAYEQRTSEAFHEWRKRVKDHRYHLRLLHDTWPPVLKAHRGALHELSDLLGDDHDLVVLREELVGDPDRYGGAQAVATVCALADRRRAELQHDAHVLGARCFAEPTGRFVDRIGAYWRVAETLTGEGPLADATVPAGR